MRAGIARWVWLPSMLAGWFPPGSIAFCLRTWASAVLALTVAFWMQIDSPASAGVTVMILSQPLRGQILSKALYRIAGTLVGATVAIGLIAAFGQDRFMVLGGAALWLGLCVVAGTLARDFRAYGALLAGYTVAIIGIGCIDRPEAVFSVAIFRVSAIMIGIVSVAVINDVTGSPSAWRALADRLRRAAVDVRRIARDAVAGRGIPDDGTCVALAGTIMALTSQVSFARTELADSALRMTGARSAMVAMLDMISCSRAIGGVLRENDVRPAILSRVRQRFGDGTPFTGADDARGALDALLRVEDGDAPPTPAEAYLIERAMALLSYGRWVEDGIRTLEDGRAAPRVARNVRLARHQDPVLAMLNGVRVIVGFSAAAAICILSGLPGSTMTLVQVATILTLSITTFDTRAFGFGALIGVPLSTLCALVLDYRILPYGSDMGFLALMIAPVVFATCLLLIHPRHAAIGLNFGVFFFIVLGLDNIQNYDPMQFIDRNVFYTLSAVILFFSLVLLPPSARRRRFRVAMTVALSLRRQFTGRGDIAGPMLISRQYDRLIQARTWTGHLPPHRVAAGVFGRIVSMGDLIGALARARRHLTRAMMIPPVSDLARQGLDLLRVRNVPESARRIMHHATVLLAASRDLPPVEREIVIGAVSGLFGAARLLERNVRLLRHYGIIPAAWRG
ncbi:FUSC family protein [Gluconacetobacter diazotrophicus]|uniref:FUSC family protein n=1 Tax=Gluconacetobacter diazotrophicus TaxID=33996 RepID=UPI00119B2346|nr:FUSC family protein [Gluconacetobacter diazotrophicus]TWB08512.1 putative membrane protein YccC [Gluconacetobacter diazotrophicus]